MSNEWREFVFWFFAVAWFIWMFVFFAHPFGPSLVRWVDRRRWRKTRRIERCRERCLATFVASFGDEAIASHAMCEEQCA